MSTKVDTFAALKPPGPNNRYTGVLPGSAASAVQIVLTTADLGGKPRMFRGRGNVKYFVQFYGVEETVETSLTTTTGYEKSADEEFEYTIPKSGGTIVLHSTTTSAGRYYAHLSSE